MVFLKVALLVAWAGLAQSMPDLSFLEGQQDVGNITHQLTVNQPTAVWNSNHEPIAKMNLTMSIWGNYSHSSTQDRQAVQELIQERLSSFEPEQEPEGLSSPGKHVHELPLLYSFRFVEIMHMRRESEPVRILIVALSLKVCAKKNHHQEMVNMVRQLKLTF